MWNDLAVNMSLGVIADRAGDDSLLACALNLLCCCSREDIARENSGSDPHGIISGSVIEKLTRLLMECDLLNPFGLRIDLGLMESADVVGQTARDEKEILDFSMFSNVSYMLGSDFDLFIENTGAWLVVVGDPNVNASAPPFGGGAILASVEDALVKLASC